MLHSFHFSVPFSNNISNRIIYRENGQLRRVLYSFSFSISFPFSLFSVFFFLLKDGIESKEKEKNLRALLAGQFELTQQTSMIYKSQFEKGAVYVAVYANRMHHRANLTT